MIKKISSLRHAELLIDKETPIRLALRHRSKLLKLPQNCTSSCHKSNPQSQCRSLSGTLLKTGKKPKSLPAAGKKVPPRFVEREIPNGKELQRNGLSLQTWNRAGIVKNESVIRASMTPNPIASEAKEAKSHRTSRKDPPLADTHSMKIPN